MGPGPQVAAVGWGGGRGHRSQQGPGSPGGGWRGQAAAIGGWTAAGLSLTLAPASPPGVLDAEEAPPSGPPPTFLHFTHHSYAQMVRVLRRTAARCAHIASTYSIGRSFDGRELLVIEFSSRPGQHELSKLPPPSRLGEAWPVSRLPGWGLGPSAWGQKAGVWDPN